MSRLSNINWAAFILGGAWGSYNGYRSSWGMLFVVVASALIVSVHLLNSIFISSIIYAFLAIMSIYLALQGNFLIVEKIQEEELSSEEKREELIMASARQRKLIISGIGFKLFFFYFLLGFASNWFMPWDTLVAENFLPAFYLLGLMLAIDVLALIVVLVVASIRKVEENELFLREKIDTETIIATPMKHQKRSERKVA